VRDSRGQRACKGTVRLRNEADVSMCEGTNRIGFHDPHPNERHLHAALQAGTCSSVGPCPVLCLTVPAPHVRGWVLLPALSPGLLLVLRRRRLSHPGEEACSCRKAGNTRTRVACQHFR
jgi:hypothetical protein